MAVYKGNCDGDVMVLVIFVKMIVFVKLYDDFLIEVHHNNLHISDYENYILVFFF